MADSQSSQQLVDMNVITQSILEFIQAEKAVQAASTGKNSAIKGVSSPTAAAAGKDVGAVDSRFDRFDANTKFATGSKRNRKQKAKKNAHIKWDPRWLKKARKLGCIPLAFVCFLLLVFINTESRWIYFGGKTDLKCASDGICLFTRA